MSIFKGPEIGLLRSDRLILALASLAPNAVISDDLLKRSLLAAEKTISRRLKVLLEPTKVFALPAPTGSALADALDTPTQPWIEEAAYDYDAGFFQENRWGYTVTRQHPIISVDFLRFAYPAPTSTIFMIPNDWMRIDKKFGHIRLVPATSQFTAPLGAFLLQALGGGGTIPAMIQIQYTAGLANVPDDWPDLLDVIYKQAVLNIIEGIYLPASGSISGDGLSQSMSVDMTKYRDLITDTLMGPKGSNGGLWTAIHGIQGMVFGPTN